MQNGSKVIRFSYRTARQNDALVRIRLSRALLKMWWKKYSSIPTLLLHLLPPHPTGLLHSQNLMLVCVLNLTVVSLLL